MKSRVKLLSLAAALAIVAGPLVSYDSLAAEVHPNLASCKTNAGGHLYVALGPTVLAIPIGGDTMIDPVRPPDHIPAPNPEESQGCPDNPAQMNSYSFLYQMQAMKEEKAGTTPAQRPTLDLLQLIARRTPSSGDNVEIELAEQECARAAIHEELPNGLTACRIKPLHDARIEDWASSYIAHSEIYKTPLGQRFVVNCDPNLYSRSIGNCNVAYLFTPKLFLSYRFQPFRGLSPIPIADVIDFDRGLRQKLESMVVKDFTWPAQSDTAHQSPEKVKP